ncbi:MAG TPA: transporter substrate-binding domain-containing protein [Candidatus Acidoferrum sp.]|jgi:polar amino acid transport system substrate-binding protein|nr:transporter substrate-binding domain-containing protein [Candidatus Acidoferrum sp.]
MRAVTFALAAAILLAACGGTATPNPTPATGVATVDTIAAEVPASIKSLSPLQIATDATYAPNEFVNPDSGAIQGWDIDFGLALCKVMGLVCTFNNVTFDDIIAQLKASTPSEIAGGDKPRYAFSISSWTPTQKREAGGIDFITYYKAGEAWLVKSGGPTITSAADMCGHGVAVEAGTTEESDAWGFMGKQVGGTPISGDTDNCAAAGKQDINVLSFGTQTEANSALLSGRADFGWLDQPVAGYQVTQTNGKLQLGGTACSVSPYGIALVKGSALETAMLDAVKYLIDHGFYTSILTKWGVQSGAVASSDVALNNNSSIGPSCVPAY